jgi:hypothetical protein
MLMTVGAMIMLKDTQGLEVIPNPLLTTPLHGGDKADGRWQKKERTSGKKGAIEADLVLPPIPHKRSQPLIVLLTRYSAWATIQTLSSKPLRQTPQA